MLWKTQHTLDKLKFYSKSVLFKLITISPSFFQVICCVITPSVVINSGNTVENC